MEGRTSETLYSCTSCESELKESKAYVLVFSWHAITRHKRNKCSLQTKGQKLEDKEIFKRHVELQADSRQTPCSWYFYDFFWLKTWCQSRPHMRFIAIMALLRTILCLDCFSVSMLFHIIVAAQNDRQRTRRAGKDEEECWYPTERFVEFGAKICSNILKRENWASRSKHSPSANIRAYL